MSFVVGTAGHIDHGKSTLITALTGIDPDRLAEEKRRGMTIDRSRTESAQRPGDRRCRRARPRPVQGQYAGRRAGT
jgi:translation initiation factor 2 gamma subunit (eIF-2gamma)